MKIRQYNIMYKSGKWPAWCTVSSVICLFESSTCCEQLCSHLQEDSCINTTSGIITLCYLRFVVPCIFNHLNKTTNQMQQSIVKFIALSYRYCSTCFGHYNAHHQEPVKLPLQPLVSVWMWRWKCSQPWSVC
jgi:hypothetical protein